MPEDMYVAALTKKGVLYVFSFDLKKVENWKEIAKAQKKGNVLLDEDSDEKLADLVDFPYSKTYKNTFHQYNYLPKYPDGKKQQKQKKQKTDSKVEASDPSEPLKPYIKVNLFDYHSK